MLALICLFFNWYIFTGAWKIANILCQIILITETFQLTTTDEKCFRHSMLAFCVYVTCSLTLLYLEGISLIQCQLPTRKNAVLRKNKCQGILPTNMLASLVNLFIFVSNLYMDDIANMIFQLYQYFIQHQHDQSCRYLCFHYWVSTSDYIYFPGQRKQSTFYVS